MTDNNLIILFILKLSMFIASQKDFNILIRYFKEKLYRKYDFSKQDLYVIQGFINSLKNTEECCSELKNDFSRLKSLFCDNQKMLILLRVALYFSMSSTSECRDKLIFLSDIFGFKNEFLDRCHQFINVCIDAKSLDIENAIIYFFELPESYDKKIFEFIMYISKTNSYKKKKVLHGLNAADFQNEFDRKALDSIKNMTVIQDIGKKVFEYGIEKVNILQQTGSNIKVNKNNFPDLYETFLECCEILEINTIPRLYIQQGFINAYTIGLENHIVVIHSASIGCLTHDELMFLIGHELGHIKSGHVFYHWLATSVLPALGSVIGNATLGIGSLISSSMEIALLNWIRKSEFTADRAGLLTCQNYDAAVKTFMKIAGAPIRYYNMLNTNDFLQQAREFEGFDEEGINKALKLLSIYNSDHPWTVMRAAQLDRWITDGFYDQLLNLKCC